ncbi:MAG: hypothetical protein GY842_25345 [bacterium]|nr:hypothetical protein [bacterium]
MAPAGACASRKRHWHQVCPWVGGMCAPAEERGDTVAFCGAALDGPEIKPQEAPLEPGT